MFDTNKPYGDKLEIPEPDFTNAIEIKFKRTNKDVPFPSYKLNGDSGFDFVASETVIVEPGETIVIPTGIALNLYKGMEVQVRPRSGISSKTKIRVTLGTGDSNYRGELCVIVDNIAHPRYRVVSQTSSLIDRYRFDSQTSSLIEERSNKVMNLKGEYEEIDKEVPVGSVIIRKGERIAQGVLCFVIKGIFVEVDELSETNRGTDGFGSTGV